MLCQFCCKGKIHNLKYTGEYNNLHNYIGDCSNCDKKTTIGTTLKMREDCLNLSIEEEIKIDKTIRR